MPRLFESHHGLSVTPKLPPFNGNSLSSAKGSPLIHIARFQKLNGDVAQRSIGRVRFFERLRSSSCNALAISGCLLFLGLALCNPASAQQFNGPQQQQSQQQQQRADQQRPQAVPLIADVRILGNATIPTSRILARLKTRPGRYYDSDLVQIDSREIMAMKNFRDVQTYTQNTPAGIVVTFEVVERPVVQDLKFLGNRNIADRELKKQIGMETGDPLDVFAIRLAKQRLQEFYERKGYPNTEVEILEGTEATDRNVVFLIHEDQKRKVWQTEFIGNTIAPDGRLKTFVKTKPGPLKRLIGSKVDEAEIENDVKRITAYYRSLGFFNARVNRELVYDDQRRWLSLRFIIDEGPRYEVESISIRGNSKFSEDQIRELLELQTGLPYNEDEKQRDVNLLKDLYGSQGHIFADVTADLLFLEEPGKLDLVYQIEEGDIYRVRNINVHIAGEYGVTKESVVRNRVSISPGDVIDIRQIRDSERRLRASGLFSDGLAQPGAPPRIEVSPVDAIESERTARLLRQARGPSNVRSQSPNSTVRYIDLHVYSR